MDKIYKIPDKFKVGFQAGGLGFLVYEKENGELSSPVAFENWRNKNIPIKDFQNDPTSGFKIVKFIGGDSYSHARLSQVRIEDPRGFQFEIKIDNFFDILKNDTCDKLVLRGEYIYAWDDQRISLISQDSNEYKSSIKFSDETKYDPEECIPGEYYMQDNGTPMLFLGRLRRANYKRISNSKYRYCSSFENSKIYPKYDLKYVFKNASKNKISYFDYVQFSSSKLTKKFVKFDRPKLDPSQLNDEIIKFYMSDHGTTSEIFPMSKFNRFIIPEQYKITDISQVPGENTYTHVYYALEDPQTLIHLGYRMDHVTFAPTNISTIEEDENGNNFINNLYDDTRMMKHRHLKMHDLIRDGKLYVIPNENRFCGEGIMIASDQQKVLLNVF